MPNRQRKRNYKTNKRQKGRSRTALPDAPRNEGKLPTGHGRQADTIVSIPRLNAFGLRTRRTLRYEDSVAFTGSTSVSGYVFSANGLYDPNVTGTGHQPMFFDQMMTLFEHYTVLKARLSCHVTNVHASQMCKFGVIVGADVTSFSSNYQVNMETGLMTYATLSPNASANSMATLYQTVDLTKFGGMQQVLDVTEMRGTVAANPTEQSYIILMLWNPQNSTVPSVLMDVIIEYDAVFTEPRLGSQSISIAGSESKR